MYEFELFNHEIKKSRIVHGYSLQDACRRAHIDDCEEWEVVYAEYVD